MIRLRHTLGSIVALTLCAVACSSSSLGGETQPLSDAGADSSNGGSGGSGGHSGTGGGSGGGGGSAAGGGSGNGGDAGSSCPDPIAPPVVRLAPGTPTADPNAKGKGACAARSVAQIVSQIHTAHPELADVQAIFDPNVALGDGSFVYAYLTPAGGIDLVFKRGGGDCPAGCTENEYWYFATDASCTPAQVGHYHPTDGDGGCVAQEGTPLWGRPGPMDPAYVCHADLTPAALSGTYHFTSCGTSSPCSTTYMPPLTVRPDVTLTVAQAPGDPTKGTVTVHGTGVALVDDRPLAATFTRKRLRVSEMKDNLPSTCPEQHSLSIDYDFEGIGGHGLSLEMSGTPDCAGAPNMMCKGMLSLDLTATDGP